MMSIHMFLFITPQLILALVIPLYGEGNHTMSRPRARLPYDTPTAENEHPSVPFASGRRRLQLLG
jgi:hypothetical protein